MRDDTSTATVVAAAPGPVLHGDPHDFAGLYIRHRDSLTRHARRHLNDVRDADEVVQEAFLRLFLALPELGGELQALAYCRRTITNLCIDRYRADARRPNLVDLESVPQERFADDDRGDPVVRAEDAALVREALSMLPALHRSALVKREIEEKSLPVIADELAIPEDNVKHLLFRARRTLRKLLAGTSLAPGVDVERGRALPGAPRSKSGIAALLVLLVLGLGSGPDLEAVPVVGVDLPDVIGVTRLTDAVADVVADVVDRVTSNEGPEANAAVRPDAEPGREGEPASSGATAPAAPGADASSPGGSASQGAGAPSDVPAAVVPPAGTASADERPAGGKSTLPVLPPVGAAGPGDVVLAPPGVARPGQDEAGGDGGKAVVRAPADAQGSAEDVVTGRKPVVAGRESPRQQEAQRQSQDSAGQGGPTRRARPVEGKAHGQARGAEAKANGQAQAASRREAQQRSQGAASARSGAGSQAADQANAQAGANAQAAQARARAQGAAKTRAAAQAQAKAEARARAAAGAQAEAQAAARAQAQAAANAQAAAKAQAKAQATAKAQAAANAQAAADARAAERARARAQAEAERASARAEVKAPGATAKADAKQARVEQQRPQGPAKPDKKLPVTVPPAAPTLP